VDVPSAKTVVVVAGGAPLDATLVASLRGVEPDAVTIAADSGIDLARLLERPVTLAVGDFDSVSAEGLAWVEATGARIERHPATKDATDLELALDAALTWSPARVVVLGGHGGRLDHLLANVAVLSSDRFAAVEVSARIGSATVTVVRRRAELDGVPGALVSLLPQHGGAVGVTTSGLRYPLVDEPLEAGSTRGVSNEFLDAVASVDVRSGVLAVVQPGHPLDLPSIPSQE
jgi:thiamine pyrophosphokinase